MAPTPNTVTSDEALPASTEVAIIGGGIIGVAAALTLAERKIPCALFEKGVIAGEQSSRNWGWCRQQGRDPRELPLIIESLRLWRDMNHRVGAETGFVTCGIASLATNEQQMTEFEDWRQLARQHDIDARVINAQETNALLPGATRAWRGALYTPHDGRAEPTLAAPAMALAARQHGAKLFTATAVRSIETKAGRVSGIITEKGSVDCSAVILAGGAWSRTFCRNLGIDLPQLKVRSSVLRTAPLTDGPTTSTSGPGFALRRRADGGYNIAHRNVVRHDLVPDSFRLLRPFWPLTWMSWRELHMTIGRRFWEEAKQPTQWNSADITPFERCRILDPAPNLAELNQALKNLCQAYPVFRGVTVTERWAGMIDVMPDVIPVISTVTQRPGLVIATGFSGHGFGIGPAAGQLSADLATSATPIVNPTDFRYERLIDGSPMTPMTTP